MDISAAVFTHGLIVVSRAGQGNTHNSATEEPGGAQSNNTTEELLKRKISNAYVSDCKFRALQVLTHLSHVGSKGSMVA